MDSSFELRALAPIGVFDSGVGGLTVARAIVRHLPEERIEYIADQAHVPYGGRPLEEVRDFAMAISAHLFASGAKAVVMACNISSATALTSVRERFGSHRVLGVIEHGAARAIAATRNRRIGVLATAGTVATRAYSRHIQGLDPSAEVIEVACPRFVPLVEAGELAGPEAEAACQEYLAPILARGADTVVLGCTHYPFLAPALERVLDQARAQVALVDPAEATALALRVMLAEQGLLAPRRELGRAMTPRTISSAGPGSPPEAGLRSVSNAGVRSPSGVGSRARDRLMTTGDLACFRSQLAAFAGQELIRRDPVVVGLRPSEIFSERVIPAAE